MPFNAGSKLRAENLELIAAKFKNSASQTGIVTATNTTVQLPTTVYNFGGGIVSISSHVVTLGRSGLWAFAGSFEMATGINTLYGWIGHPTNTTNTDRYALYTTSNRNGVDTAYMASEREFSAGAQLKMWVWHNHGSDLSIAIAEQETWLSVRYIHGV